MSLECTKYSLKFYEQTGEERFKELAEWFTNQSKELKEDLSKIS